eukprot:scaffold372753_cov34-Prasinocladus_malaysianus.AAC.1
MIDCGTSMHQRQKGLSLTSCQSSSSPGTAAAPPTRDGAYPQFDHLPPRALRDMQTRPRLRQPASGITLGPYSVGTLSFFHNNTNVEPAKGIHD